MALALVSARYPQPSRMMGIRGLGVKLIAPGCQLSARSGERRAMSLQDSKTGTRGRMNLPDYPDWILLEYCVCTHNRQAILQALSDQQSVKWVAVMALEPFY